MPFKNPNDRKAYQKEWYQKNKLGICTKRKKTYESSRDVYKLWLAARQRAQRKGLAFDLEVDDIVIPELCPILKEPLVRLTRYAPSVDRIDPSKGYTKDNIWVISRRANTMKNDANVQDLRRFAEWAIKL